MPIPALRPATVRRRHGFSLIELMIAIAIVGVMAGIALPNIVESIQRQQAIASEKEVSDFITRARNFARTTGCETRVSVDNSSTPHSITIETTETDTSAPCFSLDDDTTLNAGNALRWTASKHLSLTVFTRADNSATTPAGSLTFNRGGGTTENQEVIMTVSNSFGGARTIEVWPLIGSVNVVAYGSQTTTTTTGGNGGGGNGGGGNGGGGNGGGGNGGGGNGGGGKGGGGNGGGGNGGGGNGNGNGNGAN